MSGLSMDIDGEGFTAGDIISLERISIRRFVTQAVEDAHFSGKRVLDFGCGEQPYRDIVLAAGRPELAAAEYCPYDPRLVGSDPGLLMAPFGAILCTQVMQYIESPEWQMQKFRRWLGPSGLLVMTYGTNWREIENEDLWRFTKAGMELLLKGAGFAIVKHELRAELNLKGFRLALGYGVIAETV